ncbi:xin actin-binding repeat-containing protein 1-like [Vanacampus margaritifer]
MAQKSTLTRSQSLRSVHSSSDKSAWMDAKVLSKAVSVSKLMERNGRQKMTKTQPEPPKTREDKRERSLAESGMSRSKSMGSLQNDGNMSFEDLKACFEMREEPASAVRAADKPKPSKDVKPAMKKEINKSAMKQRTRDAPVHPRKSDEKERNAQHEKRRSVADFREKAFVQEGENVCVSVKALSAIYLSKVASQEAELRPLKPVQDQSSELGRRVKQVKVSSALPSILQNKKTSRIAFMEEDAQLNREDHLQRGPDNNPETQSQQFSQSQTSKESLYQQRQKCELRRLLKHTHPELKMSDRVVDEALAEVLSSEAEVTADESGYEGEVRSRRLIFEKSHTPKMLTTEEVENEKFSNPDERPGLDPTVASSPDPNRECEDVKKIDIQATRRIFESHCVDASQSSPEKVSTGVLTDLVQELEKEPKQGSCGAGHITTKEDDDFTSHDVQEQHQDGIKTKASLTQNNPFLSQNIEHSHAHTANAKIAADADCAAKVKDRTHLFESMPFDQIRHQNKDEVETMVETLKESLSSLHHLNAIHADGSIIEVNETMRAKKAKYTKSAKGAEIDSRDVSEGNFQNFVLRVLPRANLRPRVTYLTQACDGVLQSASVAVPVHPHQFTGTQDTECNTANVVQLLEDILNQDNSLRKGVIIQEAADKSADVLVYSLYKYSDEEDVRRFCPQEYPVGTDGRKSPFISPRGACPGSVSPVVTTKGNVKLFKSCIDRGELEYLKTLQEKSTVDEEMLEQSTAIDPEQRVDLAVEGTPEWAPVDVKRLRSMFSEDQTQSRPDRVVRKDLPGSNATSKSVTGPNVTLESVRTGGQDEDQLHDVSMDSNALAQFQTRCGDQVIQPELIKVVDDDEEIPNLQTANNSVQQATMEAQSLHQLAQEKQESKSVQSIELTSAPDRNSQVMHHKPNMSPQKSDKTDLRIKSAPEETHTENRNSAGEVPVVSPDGSETQEEEEIVFQGKLKAALDSLERSNINVTRGDFRAAMIYRNSSKAPEERLRNATQVSGDKAINQVCVTEPQTQVSPNQVTEEGPQKRRPLGPKPVIPPKPEHLKVKRQNNQPTNNDNSFKPLKDTDKQTRDTSKINTGTESEHDGVSHVKLSEGSQKSQEIPEKHQIHESPIAVEKYDKDRQRGEKKDTVQEGVDEDTLVEEKTTETDETHIDFNEACKKFGGTNDLPKKSAPVKPKRTKTDKLTRADAELRTPLLCHSCYNAREQKDTKGLKQEGKVELRAKKGRTETEDERRRRLSVHMDEIVRGNIGAAAEIFDNLRKQEELRGILGRVDEIEEDTSEVDVTSLRKVFENVPDWVVPDDKKKPKRAKEQTTTLATEGKSSMAHVFGDLERASEEIMTLKEQTLARLVDIEEAIKKALYSVSTLKSESDIAGLSCLFKESLGSERGSPASGNKIIMGLSKTASPQVKEAPAASPGGARTPKPREGSPSSPAFISIQSAARKCDKPDPSAQEVPTYQEKFCSTKLLECNSPAFGGKEPTGCFPQREISVLEVRTDGEGSRILGAKTRTSSTDLRATGSALHHVATNPDILLPVNQNP